MTTIHIQDFKFQLGDEILEVQGLRSHFLGLLHESLLLAC